MNLTSTWREGRFRNYTQKDTKPLTLRLIIKLLYSVLVPGENVRPKPTKIGLTELDVIPVRPLSAADILAAPDMSLWKLSHSAVLMKLARGRLFLTDPVLSERASPFTWAGPKRFSRLPIELDGLRQLPRRSDGTLPLTGVFISHDHYDHLDARSIRILKEVTETFFVPLKVGQILQKFGVEKHRIREFDWWDCMSLHHGELHVVCTPTHHNSGRSILSIGQTLWSSWCITQPVNLPKSPDTSSPSELRGSLVNRLSPSAVPDSLGRDGFISRETPAFRIYFSGDSGYHKGFAKIGEVCGPFDVALLENGQYNYQYIHGMHMLPSETAQANIDLKSKWMIPIHNSTFSLSSHTWWDPLENMEKLSKKFDFNLCTPMFGERVDLTDVAPCGRWWKSLMTAPTTERQNSEKSRLLDGAAAAASTY